MEHKILVAYATRTGSTRGVAEKIGATLSGAGAEVEVLPVQAVKDAAPYRAIVVGSPIHGNQWLPEALQFVRLQQAALVSRPFAAFSVCMTLAMRGGEQYRPAVAGSLTPVRALARPVSEGLFAGALLIRRIPSLGDRLKFRLSVLAGVWTEGDHRDWEAIQAWAEGLQPHFALGMAGVK
ncbi:MAG: flavodoxin [Chloroflexi bacterium]|nr:flavodoxin [Chloroflexota bacterium]